MANWSQVNWQKAYRVVRSLRFRIFRATRQQNWKEVKSLTKLLLRSYSNLLVSVRRATQENKGRRTAGIDGEIATTPGERARLVDELRSYQPWKTSPVRRVYIPKSNSKMRPLGIPTLRDRVFQAVVKNALEARFEAEFEAKSYGFRQGRSCQDAIEEIHAALNEGAVGCNRWILDADIKGAFDHISHEFILNRIGKMPGQELVKQWLKAGYVEMGIFHHTTEGTPQGGVASPFLANIALDGLAKHLEKGYRIARYADDFVVMTKSREAIELAATMIESWLKQRGLELNKEKTRIVHRTEGFNFLGFNVRMYGRKLLIKPQKENTLKLLRRIRKWLKEHPTTTTEAVIEVLNPILRGWALYYRNVVSKRIFTFVDYKVHWMLWRWAKRRHPNKGKLWIHQKYFRDNTLSTKRTKRGRKEIIYLIKLSEIPILRHVKIKGTNSPDDQTLTQYWKKRTTWHGRSRLSRGSKLYQIAERQDWKCLMCREPIFNGESVDVHHITPVKEKGTDRIDNLVWLHRTCHYQRHQQMKRVTG